MADSKCRLVMLAITKVCPKRRFITTETEKLLKETQWNKSRMPFDGRMASSAEKVDKVEHLTSAPATFSSELLTNYSTEVRANSNIQLDILGPALVAPASKLPGQPVTEKQVRAILKIRRARDQYFPRDMFADPAWDMLLALYAARLGQRRMSVGDLCQAAAVPATTALRWIATLQSNGLIERSADPLDGRRFYLSLTASGLDAMANYFKSVTVDTVPI